MQHIRKQISIEIRKERLRCCRQSLQVQLPQPPLIIVIRVAKSECFQKRAVPSVALDKDADGGGGGAGDVDAFDRATSVEVCVEVDELVVVRVEQVYGEEAIGPNSDHVTVDVVVQVTESEDRLGFVG